MIKSIAVILLLAFAGFSASATHFVSPLLFEQWEAAIVSKGSKVKIHLKGGSSSSADLRLVDSAGYMIKNLGFIAKDFKYDEEQVFDWIVWSELPAGNLYQLAFHPKLESGKATTAFSQPFTIVPNKTKQVFDGPDYDEEYYFTSEINL
ncbi:hypothetical protein BJV82DRAFT_657080 [Fennellomyces sp. T-0311]|nr:hypothetical protein BJV82DRAFT_657080 [Fennellomyces sp. T-0311]